MNGVWATKHRPNSLTGIVGQDALVAELMTIVAEDAPMQHYIFYSPEAGTGKTSVAHALAKDLGYQLIVFNASSKKVGTKTTATSSSSSAAPAGDDIIKGKSKALSEEIISGKSRKLELPDLNRDREERERKAAAAAGTSEAPA